MPSKLPERQAIGYMIPERRLEVGWRRETSRIMVSDCFLATVVGLSTLSMFFYVRPAYCILALLIKCMLPIKCILFVKHIFSCCCVL